LTITIKRLDYERAFEMACNHPDEVRAEKYDCAKYGPSLLYVADMTPFGADVLVEENKPSHLAMAFERERIPCSGHTILVHGETADEDTLIEFTLMGFGPHDLKMGERKVMPVRQKIAIQKSKALKTQATRPPKKRPSNPGGIEKAYG
jgi:hypothetical protein